MQDAAAHPYLLKVLSGPHQGAEIALTPGDTLIGRNPDCDIILSDVTAADTHIKLNLSEDGALSLTALAPNTYLDGKILGEEETETPFEHFQYITLGTTHLVVGPSDSEWPVLMPPTLEVDTTESDEAIEASEGHTQAENTATPAGGENEDSHDDVIETKFLGRRIYIHKHPKAWRRPAIAALATIVILVFVFLGPKEVKTWGIGETELLLLQDQVESILDDITFIDNASVYIERGQVVIRGYVDTDEDRGEARQRLQAISPFVASVIWSEEGLVLAAQQILDILSLPLKVTPLEKGSIKVSGYHADPKTWDRAYQHLLTDIPGLITIEDAVITATEVAELTTIVLQKYDLQEMIAIIAAPDTIVAQGSIGTHTISTWKEALSSIKQLFSDTVPVLDWVIVSSVSNVEEVYFDSGIASINLSGIDRWITLQNGKTYFEGSQLPSGYIINQISTDGVTLKRGDDAVSLTVGESITTN